METIRRAEELINIIDNARDELARLIFTEQVECVAEPRFYQGGYFAFITVKIAGKELQLSANENGYMCDFSNYVQLKDGIGNQTERTFVENLKKRLDKQRLEQMKKNVAELEKKSVPASSLNS
ncbi:MAG: hypothetical protein MJZ90_10325 [Bacteroidales bacterium]|nr:hypothetical protein [Bacteroidales bacterium]